MQGEAVSHHPPKKALFVISGNDPYFLPAHGGAGDVTQANAHGGIPGLPSMANFFNSKPLDQIRQYVPAGLTNLKDPRWHHSISPVAGSPETLIYTDKKTGNQVDVVMAPNAQHCWSGSASPGLPVIGETYHGYDASSNIANTWLPGKPSQEDQQVLNNILRHRQ